MNFMDVCFHKWYHDISVIVIIVPQAEFPSLWRLHVSLHVASTAACFATTAPWTMCEAIFSYAIQPPAFPTLLSTLQPFLCFKLSLFWIPFTPIANFFLKKIMFNFWKMAQMEPKPVDILENVS